MGTKRKMAEKTTSRRFTAEFKEKAVRLAMQSSDSIASVAKDPGVTQASLYQWVADHKKQQEGGLSFEEREELARLRRENRRLKMERDILKKHRSCWRKTTREQRKDRQARQGVPGPSGV